MQDLGMRITQFTEETLPHQALSNPLSDELAAEVVEFLKQEADRYWFIDPQRSLEFAARIITIGKKRQDLSQEALGLMARGDALKFLLRIEEAWDALEQAGNMFQAAGDEVGWARTRIGRLDLGIKMNRIAETFADAQFAREIFIRYGESERLLRLDFQSAITNNYLGNQHQALELFQHALELAETLGETGKKYFGQLYLNTGFTHDALGDFRQALVCYERSRPYMVEAEETRNIALLDINTAYIARAQGHYRRALDLLHGVLAQVSAQFPMETLWAKSDMVECYLSLNRYAEARDLAKQVIKEYRTQDAYELARTLLHLAVAEAESMNFQAAVAALDEAEPIFTSLGATRWVFTTHLWRGRIALKRGDALTAHQESITALKCFESGGHQTDYAVAALLEGQALLVLKQFQAAKDAIIRSLAAAQHGGLPSLRYSAHVTLGQIMDVEGKNIRSARHYQAAAATVERVQRGLSITLRPGFLEDKGEALCALIALYLREGRVGNAFETLERAKSQLLLSYLTDKEHLRWVKDDARSNHLIEELDRLRAEHQWYYRLAYDPPRNAEYPSAVSTEQALLELSDRERRMRAVTEQLYLRHKDGQPVNPAPTASFHTIQQTLDESTLLIEFYKDGTNLWAFTLDQKNVSAQRLSVSVDTFQLLLCQLQNNIATALRFDPQSDNSQRLTVSAQRILHRLYSLLIEPLGLAGRGIRRLVIVPYGGLHYLPFHLLYNGGIYLFERYETVILPSASLLTRPRVKRKPGALVLAHSWNGQLDHTCAESQIVHQLFDGVLHTDDMARRTDLQTDPVQILHIAAHGQHRLDQPDLSYLQLADGQLYADDLLQQDLSYELVTLSACETGKANVSAGDELIGLGRGFLYAGAGALLASLWQVADVSTMQFMERMYIALRAGVSKSAALREAQMWLLRQDPQMHPAFWGAFQLIGDDSPLSDINYM